jgi:hypothetical protein
MEKDILQLTSTINLQLELESVTDKLLEVEDQSVFDNSMQLTSAVDKTFPVDSTLELELRSN